MRKALILAIFAVWIAACRDGRESATAGPWQRIDLAQEPPASGAEAMRARSLPLGVLDPLPPLAERWQGKGALVRGIAQAPGRRVSWRVKLGGQPSLAFIPLGGPAGGTRRVTIREGAGEPRVLFEAPTAPPGMPAAARQEIALTDFAGREVEIAFEANAATPEARITWGSPEVIWRTAEKKPANAASAARPNILLIGLDTTRADAVGPRPDRVSLTPALDALAAESDVWLDAYSAFNVTNPSFASIFTGLYGKHHGAYELTPPGLAQDKTTLAEIFAAAGYRTTAVVSARFLGAPESGIVQGFETVRRPETSIFAAENAVGVAMQQIAGGPEPFFFFLHLFDAHTPHTPPLPYAEGHRPRAAAGMMPVTEWIDFRSPGRVEFDDWRVGGARELYDGEIAYIDRELGRLFDFLRSRGLLENTLVAVVADHGENLNEHGVSYRHAGLFESTTHVPMMIRWPGASRAGHRIEGLAQTIDLFPTLLRAAGLPVPAQDGLDLGELFANGKHGRRAVFAEHASHQGAMVRTADYRLAVLKGMPLLADGSYLFDTSADPRELENLAGHGLAEEAELHRILEAWLADAAPPGQRGAAPLTPEEEKELRALGYLP